MPAKRSPGTRHPLPESGTKTLPPNSPPLVKAQCVAPLVELVICNTSLALMEALLLAVSAEKGVICRLEPDGQDLMNGAARVKIWRGLRGVAKGEGIAAALEAVRMKVWWRASTVTISAATVRTAPLVTKGAAPR